MLDSPTTTLRSQVLLSALHAPKHWPTLHASWAAAAQMPSWPSQLVAVKPSTADSPHWVVSMVNIFDGTERSKSVISESIRPHPEAAIATASTRPRNSVGDMLVSQLPCINKR